MKRLLTIALVAALATAAPAVAQMKPPMPMSAKQFADSVPGESLVLAVRVTGRERDAVHAVLLARDDDSHYRATGTTVDLYYPAGVAVVMGSDADVKTGAVLFVDAVATTRGHADVKRVTVITQYVSVQ